MIPLISVVIPTRRHESPSLTIETLMQQTIQDIEIHVIVDHEGRGQSWARNRGAEMARGRYLLFSDNDLIWEPRALEKMHQGLLRAQEHDDPIITWRTGYAYPAYQFYERNGGELLRTQVMCLTPWDWRSLRQWNYISTMALINTDAWWKADMQFDEDLRRLEDWDIWLTFGERGYRGVCVPEVLFRTEIKPGVSHQNPLTHEEVEKIVRKKHGI